MPVILITGCSTGIGFATAEALARNGNMVYATMRTPANCPQIRQLVDAEKLPIKILPLDVLDDQSVQNAVNKVISDEGVIDVLINNAGVGSFGSVEELSIEMIRKDMETNYFGTVRCIKAVLPIMRERRSGSIINVTSVAGKVYSNFHGAYSASKAAVEAFSESLAQEMKPFNVKVAVVEPGIIETPIFRKVNAYPQKMLYPNLKRFMSLFAASLENHVTPSVVAEVIDDMVTGRTNSFRNPAGPDANPLLTWRGAASDEDWINSVDIDDETWISFMEQNMGLNVRKYMEQSQMPQFN
ncbi:SDR family oxidoreductase [Segetibacter sp.]|jgi:NAD(P)-dependent dehydrogenase (short-subunit alcohol dehydrogenase family)|uniref:SDR family oxidoreductase n=1 Tax=Segetibacter sp. TaxID=2231182 RepID=UPI00260507A0|nr:SDR family oxidoreductase [Segetibacter sp.]MCW3080939.1 family NAD(P)-dependent oxidoreductase [Segetibacter sp.]